MTLQARIDLLAQLGEYLKTGGDEGLDRAIRVAYAENNWFTEENTREALRAIADNMLDREKLTQWAGRYLTIDQDYPPKTVAVIMAGNIPLVGFHDWLCIFVSGQRASVKLSSKDKVLLPFLMQKMGEWVFESLAYTEFSGEVGRMPVFDAIIATGSNDSALHFETYFGQYPNIIRRHRNSVACLSGMETMADLYALGHDIFQYFGLGCRNVSKIYIPHGYQFDMLQESFNAYQAVINNHKYRNNFDYNMTLCLLNNIPFINCGNILLVESQSIQSRIATLHYEYYDEIFDLDAAIASHSHEIQCLASGMKVQGAPVVPFGHTQSPTLTDYADNVDVMAFLAGLIH